VKCFNQGSNKSCWLHLLASDEKHHKFDTHFSNTDGHRQSCISKHFLLLLVFMSGRALRVHGFTVLSTHTHNHVLDRSVRLWPVDVHSFIPAGRLWWAVVLEFRTEVPICVELGSLSDCPPGPATMATTKTIEITVEIVQTWQATWCWASLLAACGNRG
jgi:hypothetical protein